MSNFWLKLTTSWQLWAILASFSIWLAFPNDFVSLPLMAPVWPFALARLGFLMQTGKKAFLYGFYAASIGHLSALYWILLPVRVVAGLPWLLGILCALFVACVLATASAFFTLAAYKAKKITPISLCLILPLFWYLLEWTWAKVFAFPWLPLAGALVQWPWTSQLAAFCGAEMLGAIWLCIFFLLFWPKLLLPLRSLAILLMTCLITYGLFATSQQNKVESALNKFQIFLIEGNIDQNAKWTDDWQKWSTEVYLELSKDALKYRRDGLTLVIWPETALPYDLEQFPDFRHEIRDFAEKEKILLLTGMPGFVRKQGNVQVYNRAILLDTKGQISGRYDKMQLVPFGEYVPTWLQIDFLLPLLQEIGSYTPGNDPAPLKNGQLALGMLICYEAIFPWLAQERVENGANILIDISNDAWFGDTPAAKQHLYLTALRAIEQNRWLVRATNSGISAIIDPQGNLQFRGSQFKRQWFKGSAAIIEQTSFYARTNICYPALPLIALVLLLLIDQFKLRKLTNSQEREDNVTI